MASEDSPPDVLTSLPRTRPQRRSAKRDAVRAPAAKKATTAAKKAPAAAKKATAAKPATAKARKAAAKPTAKAAAKPKAAPKTKATTLPPAGYATPRPDESHVPSGVELVGTAIQAAGELAQIGAAVGKQALKGALGRLRG